MGQWTSAAKTETIVDPLNGEPFLHVPATSQGELGPFLTSLASTPKTGLHNPFKNVERYQMLARVSDKAARALREPAINDYFTRLIQRTSPKSYAQAAGEVNVTAAFFDNFSGDNVRYLARGFCVPGDHRGQMSNGHRFPFGPVTLITPFNFPIEIPVLQMMGALYMGNRPTIKVDSKVSVVMEQFLRMLHACGLPLEDVDMLNCDGPTMNALLLAGQPRMTLFTGSSRVSEKLAKDLHGRIKVEDAGFDWKVLGPDVPTSRSARAYVAWTSDQDAYACSGQKCSAQSILFAHSKWVRAGIYDSLRELAARRKLSDLTVGPVLTWTTAAMLEHVAKLTKIPGAKVLFGGRELTNHTIPAQYGAIEPTAVFVPLSELIKEEHYGLCTTEVFGPFQVVTEWADEELPMVLNALERMSHHLTAAVVSNDPLFWCVTAPHTLTGILAYTHTGHSLPLPPRLPQRRSDGPHGQRHVLHGPARAHDGRTAEPLVWPLGRPPRRGHRHEGGDPARVVLPPRGHQRHRPHRGGLDGPQPHVKPEQRAAIFLHE